MLIALEGIDGCGKTTQARRLRDWIAATDPDRAVHLFREPGDTALGEAVRSILLDGGPWSPQAEMLLYMAARAELYARRIRPALASGDVVLVDRSSYSTAAYQGAGLGLDAGAILRLGREATGGAWPDRVLWLKVSIETSLARRAGRAADRIESRDEAYFRRVSDAYAGFAAAEPERFVVLDGEADPDRVEHEVRAAVRALACP